VARVITREGLAQAIRNAIGLALQPDLTEHAPPLELLRLNPDHHVSAVRRGTVISLDVPEDASPDEMLRAQKMLAISSALRRGEQPASSPGRRSGSGEFPDEKTFRAKVEPIIREMRDTGEEPTRWKVAGKLHINEDYLRRTCRHLTGLDWPAFAESVG
jgi:hypothetical protein